MKIIKKNQVIIYVIALMLVVAGYLNYTATNDLNTAVLTTSTEEELAEMSNIGDAQLVSSNVVPENNSNNVLVENENPTANNEIVENNTIATNGNIHDDDINYFSTSKLERDTMYSQMLETYEKILNSNNSLETQRQSAAEEITKINSIMICENLIKTKGIKNVVIFVNGDSISVITEDKELSQEKIAQIQNIISRELNAKIENIHISSK